MMKKIFLSFTDNCPHGFETRLPEKKEIEECYMCIAVQGVYNFSQEHEGLKKTMRGIILTKGDSFSCSKLSPKLWHLSCPDMKSMKKEELECFLEMICNEEKDKELDSCLLDLTESEESFKDLMKTSEDEIYSLNAEKNLLKHTEQALRISEEKYKGIFNATNEAIFIHDAATGRIIDVNDRMLEMFGYSYKEALDCDIGKLSEGTHPYSLEEAQKKLKKAVTEGPHVFYWKCRRKNGELFYSDVSLKKIPIGDEERILAVVRDISDRRKAEESLRESEEKFRSLAENSQDFILRYDRQCRHIYANPAALRISSKTSEELIGKTHREIGFEESLCELCEKKIVSVFEKGEPDGALFDFDSPAGPIYLDWKLFPEFDSNGNIATVLGVARDISALRETQEALQKSEQIFRGYFELGLIGMSTTTQDKKWIHFNDQLCKMLGYSREELSKLTWKDITHAQSLENEMHHYSRVISGEIDGYNIDKKYIRKDGSSVYVNISVSCHRKANGEVEYLIAMIQDISERKNAEKALRKSEALLYAIIESLPFDIFAIGEDGRYMLQNSASRKIWGSVKGKKTDEIKVSSEIRSKWEESNRKAFNGELVTGETVYMINGSKKSFYQIIVPIFPEAPNKGIVGVNIDITELKKAREALIESEERLRTLINSLPDIICFKDGEGRWLEANNNYLKLFGLEGIDYRCKKNSELAELTDFYREAITVRDDSDEKTWNKGVISRRDEKIPRKDGSFLIFDNIKIPMFYPDGRRKGLIKVGRDITERKKIEEDLIRTRHNFEAFFGTVNDLIFILDENGSIVDINKAVTRRLGYSDKELRGVKITELLEGKWSIKDNTPFDPNLDEETKEDSIPLVAKNKKIIDVETKTFRGEWDGRPALFKISRDISDLKLSQIKFSTAFNTNSAIMAISTVSEGRYIDVNDAFLNLSGYERDEVIGQKSTDLGIFDDPADREEIKRIFLEKGKVRDFEAKVRKKNGEIVYGILSMDRFNIGDEPCWLSVLTDLTERKRAEAEKLEMERRLLHAQKLESLGVLAGGIAHDFNNLLTGILGNLDLALLSLPSGSSAQSRIEQAILASYRAVDLTRQMLAYSGKGKFEIKPVDINRIVRENADLFRASISRTVAFNISPNMGLPLIEADPGQIQQVIMNLITNASEAIGTGTGIITVTTGVKECGPDYLKASRLEEKPEPGQFVFVEVIDNGCGMNKETVNRLFEPFFTTKFTGRGLGMAAVLGIIRGHRGAILVDSEPGKGSTFRVLFPVIEKTLLKDKSSQADEKSMIRNFENHGTILVVDDEEPVRELCVDFLKVFGFNTLSACDGNEALKIFKENSDKIICVILDLTMPGLDGAGTFKEIKKISPEMKIILSSGYSEHEATVLFDGQGLSGFIQKPYRLGDLKDKLNQILKKPGN